MAVHDHAHDHRHPGGHHHHGQLEADHAHGGIRGFVRHLLVPHSHDAADAIDGALTASAEGIRTVKLSLVILGITAALQLVVVLVSGSVALLADTVHNLSDALTAVPLWIAFVLGRRPASRRYPWGLGRVEDLAGLFIVAMIALSAVIAGWESVDRLLDPRPIASTGWVLVAGLIGFAGNELVAVLRVRTGRRIGSAALVADGVHARTDGFTSLAVVVGVIGVWLGAPWADPAVGILISLAIAVLLVGTARDIGRRLIDGVDPDLSDTARATAAAVPGVTGVDRARLRWSGHRLHVQVGVRVAGDDSVHAATRIAGVVEDELRRVLPSVGDVVVVPTAATRT